MENRIRALLFHRIAYPLSMNRKKFSIALAPPTKTALLSSQSKSQPFIIRTQFHCSRSIWSDRPPHPPRPEAPAEPISGSTASEPIPGTDHKPSTQLLVLQRIALAYLLGISLCLAWTGISGWYLVLNGRGDEVDGRSPLRIVWDATRWPVDTAKRMFKEDE
jgi:hypothetical protein